VAAVPGSCPLSAPVLAIVRAVLEQEAGSEVVLIYGNRTTARAMFLEDLLALKDRHLARLALYFVMSREPQEVELFNGRLDGAKIRALAGVVFDPAALDEAFVCGPGSMVTEVREALAAVGATAPVHSERFTTATPPAADAGAAVEAPAAPRVEAASASITVIQDGRRRSFRMRDADVSVLDAAERAGLELPFSCRAGVCSTCRAKVVRGSVTMAHNVALEDWELEAGYVLCCQLRPTGGELELTYDEK